VKRLELVLFRGRASRAPGDTLVVPLPSDERPLRGDAGEVDWRVCGSISRMLLNGEVTGAPGEAILLPGLRPLRVVRMLRARALPSCRRSMPRAAGSACTRVGTTPTASPPPRLRRPWLRPRRPDARNAQTAGNSRQAGSVPDRSPL